MIRPTSQFCILEPIPYVPSHTAGILMPERYTPDVWEYRVISCGSKVPYVIQPGMRCLIDPTLLTQREFEHEGKKLKLVRFTEIQMLVGVPAEP